MVTELFDIVWFWAGRICAALFLFGLFLSAVAFIGEWIVGACKEIKLLAEFVRWKNKRNGD